jgi:hypothetical protein
MRQELKSSGEEEGGEGRGKHHSQVPVTNNCREQRPGHYGQVPVTNNCREQRPGHHGQVPVTNNCRGLRPGRHDQVPCHVLVRAQKNITTFKKKTEQNHVSRPSLPTETAIKASGTPRSSEAKSLTGFWRSHDPRALPKRYCAFAIHKIIKLKIEVEIHCQN